MVIFQFFGLFPKNIYLIGITTRGGAYGFSFDGLEKLVDCRSTKNPKRNLLVFILENIEKKEGKSLIEENFSYLEYDIVAKVPISQLELDLSEIKKGGQNVDLALKADSGEPGDRIAEVLKEKYEKIINEISHFDKKIKDLAEVYKKVAKFLCEDSKETSDKTAKKVYFMWQNCHNWKKEVEKRKREEERKRVLAEKKNKAMAGQVQMKTPVVKRAADNALKSDNLNAIAGKANPDEMIKELHEKRKIKSFFFFFFFNFFFFFLLNIEFYF